MRKEELKILSFETVATGAKKNMISTYKVDEIKMIWQHLCSMQYTKYRKCKISCRQILYKIHSNYHMHAISLGIFFCCLLREKK